MSNVFLGKGVIANFRLKIKGPGKVEIGDNVNLWAFEERTQIHTYSKEAVVRIGDGSRLNGCNIQARERVEIGKNCLIGSANIMDNDFHHSDPERRFNKEHVPCKPVRIGDNVWLAGQSAVLKGVSIGENSVVGFRAVVTKDVEANMVVAGNPAMVVKEL